MRRLFRIEQLAAMRRSRFRIDLLMLTKGRDDERNGPSEECDDVLGTLVGVSMFFTRLMLSLTARSIVT